MVEISVFKGNPVPALGLEAGVAEGAARDLPNQTGLLVILGKLLQGAGSVVDRDRHAAKDLIARAASLLESKLESGHASSLPRLVRGGLTPWQVRRVKAHIEGGLDSSLRVLDVARTTQLSTSHFCRAFKTSFGETPRAHILRRRVERTQEFMLTTKEPLSHIALASGLCDQAHFS